MTLSEHLKTGITTVARAWAVTRKDGLVLGFTDHDRDLTFDGITFRAGAGLTARALEQSTGLSVDNSEAIGTLSDAAITEDDIAAGRYDGAGVAFWHVNWADTAQRKLVFRGLIGEIRRAGPEFQAELRGLAEALNTPQGRIYQRDCSAVLGDAQCRVDTGNEAFTVTATPTQITSTELTFTGLDTYAPRWFEKGSLTVTEGPAKGLIGLIKADRFTGLGRTIELWEPIRTLGLHQVRLTAGCDKRMSTCRYKFANLKNYRGFPDIPGDDWLISSPLRAGNHNGGSLR